MKPFLRSIDWIMPVSLILAICLSLPATSFGQGAPIKAASAIIYAASPERTTGRTDTQELGALAFVWFFLNAWNLLGFRM